MPPPRSLCLPSGRDAVGPGRPTLCVGHRGARAFAPENTLAAFAKAAALGCSAIELDVHLSRDRQPVVHHDDSLSRCSDVGAKFPGRDSELISDYSLAELQTLDAGSWFARQLQLPPAQRQPFLQSLDATEIARHLTPAELAAHASGAIRIPTLRQALELARDLDLLVNIELKTLPRLYAGLAAAVVECVGALDMRHCVLISSFDHEQLLTVRRLDPRLATGVLSSDRLARPADYLRLLDADAYHPGCDGSVDSLGFASTSGELELDGIRQLQAAGKMVFAWTCNEPGRIARLVAAGLSGVITDYPNRFPGSKGSCSSQCTVMTATSSK